jgi:hypothetical protein
MTIVMVDDQPQYVGDYVEALRKRYGKENVVFLERVEYLRDFLKEAEKKGKLNEVRMVLDIMFGEDGNTDGLDLMLTHYEWGPYIIEHDIPVLALTNKLKTKVQQDLEGIVFEHPIGSGNIIRYSATRIDVRQKVDTDPETLVLIVERLFR